MQIKRLGIILTFVFVFQLLGSADSFATSPEQNNEAQQSLGTVVSTDNTSSYRSITYQKYKEQHSSATSVNEGINVDLSRYSLSNGAKAEMVDSFEGKNQVVKTGDTGDITWSFNVNTEGLYTINVDYYPLEGKGNTIERTVIIDGKLPFEEARNLQFLRIWKDNGEKKYDSLGNEYRREQIECPEWVNTVLTSTSNNDEMPLQFYFSKGEHKITFEAISEPIAFSQIKLDAQKEIPKYSQYLDLAKKQGYKVVDNSVKSVKVQAEDSAKKSSASFYANADRSSPANENYSATKTVLNTIGGSNWKYTGDWIEWNVQADTPGLYKLAIRAKQDYKSGSFSTRTILVNGEIPFEEARNIRFDYNKNWKIICPSDSKGNPYLFYLKKGENTIRLQVALGEYSEILSNLSQAISELSGAVTKVTMLTGSFPDPLRDYELKKTVPEIFEFFERQKNNLNETSERLAKLSGGKGEQSTAIDELLIQLKLFTDDPRIIPSKLSSFKDNISSLAADVLTASEQPLLLDYIMFLPGDKSLPVADASAWQKIKAEVHSFFLSFVVDYNTVADTNGKEGKASGEVELWLAGNAGRDQATSIKVLADNFFYPQKNIRLNIRLVDMDVLLRAVSANQGPNVAIFQDQATPVNYALRSALQDLSEFPDVEEVKSRFHESALVPLTLNGKLYGLPEQQTFLMMFYRKDILHDIGVSVPQTWKDFYAMIPVLQDHNLKIGLPSPVSTSSGGSATQLNTLFTSFLYQNNLPIFTDNGDTCLLSSREAIKVFVQWTELYTKYKVDKTLNEADYFRTGEAPIVLSAYTFYNTLSVSAPEIKGLWGMVPIPGIEQDDGSICRYTGSTVSSVIMFGNAKDKAASWEFMKWWTSEDGQMLYGREIEALQGVSARYPTANLNAMKRLPWSSEMATALTEQWKYVKGVPEVAGGYYVGRNIDNAIKSVINDNKNAREVLMDYVEDINEEITLKRQEFELG